jgi:hypothetical protein
MFIEKVMKMGESDEELAPMVDGLSSALCMLILVATVFIIGTIDTSKAALSGSFAFKASHLSEHAIYYDNAINLSSADLLGLKNEIKSEVGNTLIVTGYQYGDDEESLSKLAYNFALFQNSIGDVSMEIQYVHSKDNICHAKLSCIKWEVR